MAPLVYVPDYLASLPPLKRFGSPISSYRALNTSTGGRFLRDFIEREVGLVPPDAQRMLVTRLQDSNDINHVAALSELLLFAYFKGQGLNVGWNFPVGDGDADLRVEADQPFLVEVATVFRDPDEQREQDRVQRIVAKIDEIQDDQYWATVDSSYGFPPSDLSPAAAKKTVEAHLAAIRRSEVEEDEPVRFGRTSVQLTRDHLPTGFVGVVVGPVSWRSVTPKQVSRALKKKVKKFSAVKELDIPLVVAMFDGQIGQTFSRAVEATLFGRIGLETVHDGDASSSRTIRSNDGLFGPRGSSTRLSTAPQKRLTG